MVSDYCDGQMMFWKVFSIRKLLYGPGGPIDRVLVYGLEFDPDGGEM